MSILKASKLGSSSRLYQVWAGIITRCENPNSNNYLRYGARGISVCSEWHNYITFEQWALANGYNPNANGRTQAIERINVNGDYCPSNCKWASYKEQQNNTRKNVFVTYDGETKTLAQWAEHFGINYSTFMTRYYRGWSIDKIANTPTHKYRKRCA